MIDPIDAKCISQIVETIIGNENTFRFPGNPSNFEYHNDCIGRLCELLVGNFYSDKYHVIENGVKTIKSHLTESLFDTLKFRESLATIFRYSDFTEMGRAEINRALFRFNLCLDSNGELGIFTEETPLRIEQMSRFKDFLSKRERYSTFYAAIYNHLTSARYREAIANCRYLFEELSVEITKERSLDKLREEIKRIDPDGPTQNILRLNHLHHEIAKSGGHSIKEPDELSAKYIILLTEITFLYLIEVMEKKGKLSL